MRFDKKLIVSGLLAMMVSPWAAAYEVNKFVGADVVQTETLITYANGNETYEFSGVRLRLGLEHRDGGSAGFEIISGESDDIIDPFGSPFRLETDIAYGIYATLGKPVYVRLGWAIWQTEYTDLVTQISDREVVDSFEIGIGFNLPIGRGMTLYADYSLRDTESKYPLHVTGTGDVDYESELVSVGLNILF